MKYKRWDRIVFKKETSRVSIGSRGVIDSIRTDNNGEIIYYIVGTDSGRYFYLNTTDIEEYIQLDSKLLKALS